MSILYTKARSSLKTASLLTIPEKHAINTRSGDQIKCPTAAKKWYLSLSLSVQLIQTDQHDLSQDTTIYTQSAPGNKDQISPDLKCKK